MLKNYVIIKHPGDNGKYLFTLPKSICLETGDEVVCDTKYGRQTGVCCCDAFMAKPEVVMPLFGTQENKMRSIVGRVVYDEFTEAQEAEDAAEDG